MVGVAQFTRVLGLPNSDVIMACSGETVEDDVKEDLRELCILVLLRQISLLKSSDLIKVPGSIVLKDV